MSPATFTTTTTTPISVVQGDTKAALQCDYIHVTEYNYKYLKLKFMEQMAEI
jgi:hypothetical protein